MKNSLTKTLFTLLLLSAVMPIDVQANFSTTDGKNFAKTVVKTAVRVGTVGVAVAAVAFKCKEKGIEIGIGAAAVIGTGVGAVVIGAGVEEARVIGAGAIGAGVGVMLVGSMLALAEEKEIKIGEVTGVVVRAVLGAGTVIGAAIGSILIS